jgi:hypothetical protein
MPNNTNVIQEVNQLTILKDKSYSMNTKDIRLTPNANPISRILAVNSAISSATEHPSLIAGFDGGTFGNDYELIKHVDTNTSNFFKLQDTQIDGNTYLNKLLDRVLELHQKRKAHGFYNPDRVKNVNGEKFIKKSANVLIFTDGELHDHNLVKQTLIDFSRTLSNPFEFTITFVQVGTDESLKAYYELSNLQGLKYQYVQVLHLDKILRRGLGPILDYITL